MGPMLLLHSEEPPWTADMPGYEMKVVTPVYKKTEQGWKDLTYKDK